MSGHTPGPWEVITDDAARDWITIRSSKRFVVFADGFERHRNGETEFHNGVRVNKSDAQLIAAAPDLLTACRFALSTFDHAGWRDSYAAGQLRAAIDKAEGQQ